jgi:hypothetical protein
MEELTYTQGEGQNKLVNNYNGKNIYLFQKDGCKIYYKGDPGAKYAIIYGTTNIISLPNNKRIPYEKLLFINEYIYDYVTARRKDLDPLIITIYDTDCFKIDLDYLSKAQSVVTELNVELDKKGLCLVIDYKMNVKGKEIAVMEESALTDLLLCLYVKKDMNTCVSSVEMTEEYEEDDEGIVRNIIINSTTNEEYEGKKYNKLNRAAVIMIAGKTGHSFVVSKAIHPSSVWLFMNTFKGTIHTEIPTPPKLYSDLENYLDTIGGILEIEVPVNNDSVNNAVKVFAEVVSALPTEAGGGKRRGAKKRRKTLRGLRPPCNQARRL